MDTEHIRYLEAVAEHGSISAAARALNMNQPHLTKLLRRLEAEFDVRFFERGARGVTMTPFGERFLRRARVVDREMRDIAAELAALRGGHGGHIAVGAGQAWLDGILPGALAGASRTLPGVTLTISTGPRPQLLEQLQAGAIDVYLGTLSDDHGVNIDALAIGEVSYRLTLRREHPLLAGGPAITPHDLTRYAWILPPYSDPTMRQLREAFRAQEAAPPVASIVAVSFNCVINTLRQSDMLAMMPSVALGAHSRELASLDVEWLTITKRIGVHTVRGRSLLPAAWSFVELLRGVARELS